MVQCALLHEKNMSDGSFLQLSVDTWPEVEAVIDDQKLLQEFWINQIEEVLPRFVACDMRQSFVFALLRLYLKARSSRNVTVDKLTKTSGYSKSTFFRKFNTLSRFQYDVYQLLGRILVHIYTEALLKKAMDPWEFSEFTINFFYTAHCSVPSEQVDMLWEKYGSRDIHAFHPHISLVPQVISQYITTHKDLGYGNISQDELNEIVRVFDSDLLGRHLQNNDSKLSAAHCRSWKMMLYGFVTRV